MAAVATRSGSSCPDVGEGLHRSGTWQRWRSSLMKEPDESEEFDEREWKHGNLKLLDLDDLFTTYNHRLQHVMLINYLLLQLIISLLCTAVLLAANLIPSESPVMGFLSMSHYNELQQQHCHQQQQQQFLEQHQIHDIITRSTNNNSITTRGWNETQTNPWVNDDNGDPDDAYNNDIIKVIYSRGNSSSNNNNSSIQWNNYLVLPELLAYGGGAVMSLILLLLFHSEKCFRANVQWHSILSMCITLYIVGVESAVTLYFHFTSHSYDRVKFGNFQYTLVVVYVFLPFSRMWHQLVAGAAASLVNMSITAAVYLTEPTVPRVGTKLCITAMFVVGSNLIGLYSRYLTKIAFKRAFYDKTDSIKAKHKLKCAKKKEENLLLSILPMKIMHEVKRDFRKQLENIHKKGSSRKPFTNLYVSRHNEVSILYADIVNFTPLTTLLRVDQLVEMLNDLFGKFDEAAERNKCLRIKILGDCYYCVSGVPEYMVEHAANCVSMGFSMIDIIREVREDRNVDVDMRIGIHSGSVLSGLIGSRKWQFEIWSNDVTIANHMEQTGVKGCVHITQKTREFLPPNDYDYKPHDARSRDPLLESKNINSYLVTPKKKPDRRTSNFSGPPIIGEQQQRVRFSTAGVDLDKMYDNIVTVQKIESNPGADRRYRGRSTLPVDLPKYREILGSSKVDMVKEVENMPLTKRDQWFGTKKSINPLLLTFKEKGWEAIFIKQPDPLFKFYLLCAFLVFATVFSFQLALFPRSNLSLCTGLVLAVVMVVMLPVCWSSTIYLKIRDPTNQLYISEEDTCWLMRCLMLYDKRAMTSLGLRITLFFIISIGLYIISLANLGQCENYFIDHADDSLSTETNDYFSTTEANYVPQQARYSTNIANLSAGLPSISFNMTERIFGGEDLPLVMSFTSIITAKFSAFPSGLEQFNGTAAGEIAAGITTSTTESITDETEPTTVATEAAPSVYEMTYCDTWFFTDSVSLCLLAVWGFFRMHFLLKGLAYIIGLGLYGSYVSYFAKDVFLPCSYYTYSSPALLNCCSNVIPSASIAPAATHLLLLFMLVIALHVMDRQMEYIMRLDFQWKQQLESEHKEAVETHTANKILLRNILPHHVAEKFLHNELGDELYHESYNHVAVMFASIPNFADFCTEHEFTEEGKACLRVLNEIIVDFDLLTYKLEFQSIEKIKIVGSTYMAACGLQPGKRNSDDSEFEERDRRDNVTTLVEFAAAMITKLDKINMETFHNFGLRIGIDVGPVIAGVIGSQKPLYDIWGNTVNVASRMDYTGNMGKIHVTTVVGEILQECGWSVECRGEIDVKGKGKMVTYFVDPNSPPKAELSTVSCIGSFFTVGQQMKREEREGQQMKRRDCRPLSDHLSPGTSGRKTSLAAIKAMMESKKGTFNVNSKDLRRVSLPNEIEEEIDSSKSIYKTLPSKLETTFCEPVVDSLPAVSGTFFGETEISELFSEVPETDLEKSGKITESRDISVNIQNKNDVLDNDKLVRMFSKDTAKTGGRVDPKYYSSLKEEDSLSSDRETETLRDNSNLSSTNEIHPTFAEMKDENLKEEGVNFSSSNAEIGSLSKTEESSLMTNRARYSLAIGGNADVIGLDSDELQEHRISSLNHVRHQHGKLSLSPNSSSSNSVVIVIESNGNTL